MAKKGSFLIILAIILGLSGLGTGLYSLVSNYLDNSSVHHTWHSYYDQIDITESDYTKIDVLDITITVNKGEWIYLTFICNVIAPATTCIARTTFYLDGILGTPYVYLSILNIAHYYILSLQTIIEDVEPGVYIASVAALSMWGYCTFEENTFVVQTLRN